MQQPTRTQESFSKLWDGFQTDKEAKQARDARYRELKKAGYQVRRWVLKDQLKKYDGFGQPNGGVCDVYMLNIRIEVGSYV